MPATVQHAHRVAEAVTLFAEHVFRGNPAVLEDQFGGVGGAKPQLVLLLAGPEALGSLSTTNAEMPPWVLFSRSVYGKHDGAVRITAVGDEGLAAIEVPNRRRAAPLSFLAPPASEPDPGSVSPHDPSHAPLASFGIQRWR